MESVGQLTDEYELIDDEAGFRRAVEAITRERRIGLGPGV